MSRGGSDRVYVCVPRDEALGLAAGAWTLARLVAGLRASAQAREMSNQLMEMVLDVLDAVDYYDKRHGAEPSAIAALIDEGLDAFPPLMAEVCREVDILGKGD